MATRPSTYLNWTDGSPSKVVQPPSNFLLQGWQAGQAPPFQYANWQIWLLDQWVQYLDQLTNTGIPDQVMRLINGGLWSFNASSGVLSWSATANIAIASIADSDNALAAGSATLTDGQVAYVTVNMPINVVGTTTNSGPSANVISGMAFTGNISIGMSVTGPGIPSSTTVTGVSSNSVTISNNATSSNTNATYTFANNTALSVTVANNTAFIPQLNTILLARRVGPLIYLGVNATQITIQDGEAKQLFQGDAFTSGTVALANAAQSATVTFANALPTANYQVLFSFLNTADLSPIFLEAYVSAQSSSGFTLTFNAPTDSTNYLLNYRVLPYA